jgi:hypothetical protein
VRIRSDESTEAFLETAARDLRRQIGRSGVLESLRSMHGSSELELVATVCVGRETIDVTGRGQNLVEAYAALRHHAAEEILAAAFRDRVRR